MIWLSGDSWLDWRALIKSNLRFDDTLEGLLQMEFKTLSFARGGTGNVRQLYLVNRYGTYDVKLPTYWIHAWTEVGRDTVYEKYNKNGIRDKAICIATDIVNISNKLGCKSLVFGGQAPIPQEAHDILGDRVLLSDWKAEILGTHNYGASQYFSSFVSDQDTNLPWHMKKDEDKLAQHQLAMLTASNSFPDDAHPGALEYRSLYNKVYKIMDKNEK